MWGCHKLLFLPCSVLRYVTYALSGAAFSHQGGHPVQFFTSPILVHISLISLTWEKKHRTLDSFNISRFVALYNADKEQRGLLVPPHRIILSSSWVFWYTQSLYWWISSLICSHQYTNNISLSSIPEEIAFLGYESLGQAVLLDLYNIIPGFPLRLKSSYCLLITFYVSFPRWNGSWIWRLTTNILQRASKQLEEKQKTLWKVLLPNRKPWCCNCSRIL